MISGHTEGAGLTRSTGGRWSPACAVRSGAEALSAPPAGPGHPLSVLRHLDRLPRRPPAARTAGHGQHGLRRTDPPDAAPGGGGPGTADLVNRADNGRTTGPPGLVAGLLPLLPPACRPAGAAGPTSRTGRAPGAAALAAAHPGDGSRGDASPLDDPGIVVGAVTTQEESCPAGLAGATVSELAATHQSSLRRPGCSARRTQVETTNRQRAHRPTAQELSAASGGRTPPLSRTIHNVMSSRWPRSAARIRGADTS